MDLLKELCLKLEIIECEPGNLNRDEARIYEAMHIEHHCYGQNLRYDQWRFPRMRVVALIEDFKDVLSS